MSRSVRLERILTLFLLLLCLQGIAVARAEPAAAEPPDADTVLRSMADYLTGLDGFRLQATLAFDDVPTAGVKVQYSGRMEATLRRPDRLYMDYRDDLSAHRVWVDSRGLTVLEPDDGVWAWMQGGGSLDATLARLAANHGHSLPLDDLFAADPYSRFTAGVTGRKYLGLRDVAGTTCHHLVFGREDLTWQLWVEAGEKPLLRKLVITYVSLPMAPQYAIEIEGWDLASRIPDETFRPVIPSAAVQIDLRTLEEPEP